MPARPRILWPRAILTAFLLVGLVPAAPALGAEPAPIVFPVPGEVSFVDSFGDPRSGGRLHAGTDLMAPKGTPVVAVAAGVVSWVDDSCCHLAIDHGDGWSSWYIHLNNDTWGTDDGAGWGIAQGVGPGTQVAAGQVIGWVGDSGNAEGTASHLHFELRYLGAPVNSYPYLLAARRVAPLASVAFSGAFADDDGSPHEPAIDALAARGITRGCGAERYCPEDPMTRGQLAAFLRRYLGTPSSPTDHFTDDGDSQFADDIDALASVGITLPCANRAFCPDTPVRRDEVAEMLVRAFGPNDSRFDAPAGVDYFGDDDHSPYQGSIDRLAAAGVTVGCSTEGDFCPDRTLTRGEMATFLIRIISG